LLAFGEIEAAFEAVYFQAHRAGFAEHGQRAFDRAQLVIGENQGLTAKEDFREVLGVEPGVAAQDLVAQGEAGIERGGVDGDVNAAGFGVRVKFDSAAALVELAALCRKAEVVDFEAGVGV
jgi:hypothetical protein